VSKLLSPFVRKLVVDLMDCMHGFILQPAQRLPHQPMSKVALVFGVELGAGVHVWKEPVFAENVKDDLPRRRGHTDCEFFQPVHNSTQIREGWKVVHEVVHLILQRSLTLFSCSGVLLTLVD